MKSYIIDGGRKLNGTVKISGSKNASLPILAATILANGTSKIYNVPNISDIDNTLKILQKIGCKTKRSNGKLEINPQYINCTEIPKDLMSKMRSSVILAGAILGKYGKVKFSYPGGCDIGSRPIDIHINAFKKLGIEIKEEQGDIICCTEKVIGSTINLDFPSVGATENIILATCMAKGTTVINNAAMEPEIIDLIKFLKNMGANIEGEGTNRITIRGVDKLSRTSYNVMPDRIEAGTFLCLVAATGGEVLLKNTNYGNMEAIVNKLEESGCLIQCEKNTIHLSAPKRLRALDIKTTVYPGFPTDMQQIFSAMLLKASGTSVIVENIFENRYKYLSELRKMGTKIIQDGRTAIITGKRKIQSAEMTCTDLRGGAAIVIAALTAKGVSKISNVEYISRGYENFEKKLGDIGAKIKVIDD